MKTIKELAKEILDKNKEEVLRLSISEKFLSQKVITTHTNKSEWEKELGKVQNAIKGIEDFVVFLEHYIKEL